jgi:bifunctional lysine-specific demethylase and histidyl-hydroxylase NO66
MGNSWDLIMRDSSEFDQESALNTLLQPTTISEFANVNWNKKPLVVARKDPSFFKDLFSFEALDDIIGYSQVEYPQIRIVDRDRGEAKDLMPLLDSVEPQAADRINGVYRLYGQGCTIIIGNLHRFSPAVANLRRRLEQVIDHRVTIGSYATPMDAQGFLPHFDTVDAFMLQMQGTKLWSVWPPSFELPLEESKLQRISTETLGPPHIDVMLEPGDTLYIPRGWIHAAKTASEPSLHLTVRVHVTTLKALLDELLHDIAESDVGLRQALPLRWFTSFDVAALEPSITTLLSGIRNANAIRRIRYNLRRAHLRQGQVLASGRLSQINTCAALTPDTLLERTRDGSSLITRSEKGCTLDFNGGRLSCASAMLSVLEFLCESPEPFTMRQIPTIASDAAVFALLHRLVNIGFLRRSTS